MTKDQLPQIKIKSLDELAQVKVQLFAGIPDRFHEVIKPLTDSERRNAEMIIMEIWQKYEFISASHMISSIGELINAGYRVYMQHEGEKLSLMETIPFPVRYCTTIPEYRTAAVISVNIPKAFSAMIYAKLTEHVSAGVIIMKAKRGK
jgi:hypothetical protein